MLLYSPAPFLFEGRSPGRMSDREGIQGNNKGTYLCRIIHRRVMRLKKPLERRAGSKGSAHLAWRGRGWLSPVLCAGSVCRSAGARA